MLVLVIVKMLGKKHRAHHVKTQVCEKFSQFGCNKYFFQEVIFNPKNVMYSGGNINRIL